jgi:hypothetical protein
MTAGLALSFLSPILFLAFICLIRCSRQRRNELLTMALRIPLTAVFFLLSLPVYAVCYFLHYTLLAFITASEAYLYVVDGAIAPYLEDVDLVFRTQGICKGKLLPNAIPGQLTAELLFSFVPKVCMWFLKLFLAACLLTARHYLKFLALLVTLMVGQHFEFFTLPLLNYVYLGSCLFNSCVWAYILAGPERLALLHQLVSWLLNDNGRPSQDYTQVRSLFRKQQVPFVASMPGHPHPLAATERSGARFMMDLLARSLNLVNWQYMPSSVDQFKGAVGYRTIWCAKDLTTQYQNDKVTSNSVISMVDVDYYIDMPALFIKYALNPVCIWTFNPKEAGRNNDHESTWYWDRFANVHSYAAGGGQWTHKVWNYLTSDGDHVAHFGWKWLSFIPICPTFNVRCVDRRNTSSNRQLLLFTPIRSFWGLDAILSTFVTDSKPLERMNPIVENVDEKGRRTLWARIESLTKNPTVSVAYIGRYADTALTSTFIESTEPYCSATVSLDCLAALCQMRLTRNEISAGQVERTLTEYSRDKQVPSPIDIAILVHYLNSYPTKGGAIVSPVFVSVANFEHYGTTHDAKPSVSAFMSPIVRRAAAPVRSENNDKKCVNDRVNKVRSKPLQVTPNVAKAMDFLAKKILGNERGKLVPLQQEEVIALQNRPTQRLRNYRWFIFVGHIVSFVIRAFQKSESYDDPEKAPRNISQMNEEDALEYSRFTYAIAKLFKSHKWYAFGRKPKEIGQRVADICRGAKAGVQLADASKMDGTISVVLRSFETLLLQMAFTPRWRDMATHYHQRGFFNEGRTQFGVKYTQGTGRASGSPETSLFNTLASLLLIFLAYVDQGLSYEQAWTKIEEGCLAGGDDLVAADLESRNVLSAAAKLGLVMKPNFVDRMQNGVNFLARYYGPNVWFGDPNSCTDIPRAISKIHVTTSIDSVTPLAKFTIKIMSLAATDRQTPIIFELANHCAKWNLTETTLRKMSDLHYAEAHKAIGSWWSQFSPVDQYKNIFEDWMVDHLEKGLPDFNYTYFINAVEDLKRPEDVLALPLCDASTLLESEITSVNGDAAPKAETAPAKDMRENVTHAKALFSANATAIKSGKPLTATVESTNPFHVPVSRNAAAKVLREGKRTLVIGLDTNKLHATWKTKEGEHLCSSAFSEQLSKHPKHVVKEFDGAIVWTPYCSSACRCNLLGIFFTKNNNKNKNKKKTHTKPPLLPTPQASPAPSHDPDEDVEDKASQ